MAIDGVKIIDSDDGHDIYNAIVERYKDGVSVDTIISEILSEEQNFCIDEFYTEIYWTAVAYSLWKIGHLTDDIKQKALDIIAQGPHEFWLEIDDKALKQRQKVLDKLALQLQSENPKPVKVRKSKTKREPHFKMGDVLAVKFENKYGAIFVSDVDQSPRKIEYHLACTRLLQEEKPTMEQFLNSKIACRKDNTNFGIDTDCWFNHKDLGLLLDNLEIIGTVELYPCKLWTLAPRRTLEDIYEEITDEPRIGRLRLIDTYELVKALLRNNHWPKAFLHGRIYKGITIMDTMTKQYIETVKVSDIPWHRLTTTYGRATDFPTELDVLWNMESMETVDAAGEALAQNIEHQSTLWHATPFAMIFLLRIFKKAQEESAHNEVAQYLAEQLVELFVVIAECIRDGLMLEHADPLPNFEDMLNEEYLWSEEYDEDEDVLRYEEEDVFPDDLFFSFYYYSLQALLLAIPLLDTSDEGEAKLLGIISANRSV